MTSFKRAAQIRQLILSLSNYLRLDHLLTEDTSCCNRKAIYSQGIQMIFSLFKYLFIYFGGDISSCKRITVEMHSLRGAETARTHFTKLS